MTDGTNNENPNDPLSEAPGWASSGSDNANPPVPPQTPPPSQPMPPQTPPPAMQYGQPPQQPTYSQPGFPQQGGIQNNPPKKKRKLWLWITLAIVIPLLLCGLGVGGCAYWAYNETKPAIDATNEFYAAVKDGSDLTKLQCKVATDQNVDFNDDMQSIEDQLGELESYNFDSFESNSNSQFDIEVTGTVTRNGLSNDAAVGLNKEDGTYKVCGVREIP